MIYRRVALTCKNFSNMQSGQLLGALLARSRCAACWHLAAFFSFPRSPLVVPPRNHTIRLETRNTTAAMKAQQEERETCASDRAWLVLAALACLLVTLHMIDRQQVRLRHEGGYGICTAVLCDVPAPAPAGVPQSGWTCTS